VGEPPASHTLKPDIEPASLPLLDPAQLDALAEDGLDEARKIIELFGRSTETQLGELEDAAREGDVELFARVAHSFKGSAGIIGATRLHHRLSALNGKAGAEPLTRVVEQLRRERQDALAVMDDWLEKAAAERA
jgi:HPt (histidine-containing phosphotransfer) domain-containing protein